MVRRLYTTTGGEPATWACVSRCGRHFTAQRARARHSHSTIAPHGKGSQQALLNT